MLKQLLAPQLVVIYFLALSAIYVHFRGRERLRIARQLGDHSTFLAPYNVLMYAGSAVPNEPVVPVDRFPELAKLRDNWETIRDGAVKLFDEGLSGQQQRTTTGVSIRSSNVDGEHVGVLNKVFGWLYEIHLAGRRVKGWNRKVYYALKYSLTAVVLGLIVASALR